jgi:hypothetical protein
MSTALNYAHEMATPDVAALLRWLGGNGFSVVHERGGRGESFGNVRVDFERRGLVVRITLDRSQWMLDVQPPAGDSFGLHVALTAIDDDDPPVPEQRDTRDPLPDQLPEDVSWAVEVPRLIDWLENGDRTKELDRSRLAWRRVMTEYFDSIKPK